MASLWWPFLWFYLLIYLFSLSYKRIRWWLLGHYCWGFIFFQGAFLIGLAQGSLLRETTSPFLSFLCFADYWNKHSAFSTYGGKTGKSLARCPSRGEFSWASHCHLSLQYIGDTTLHKRPKIKTFSKPSTWLSGCPCRLTEMSLLANSGAVLGGIPQCCVCPVLVTAGRINQTLHKALEPTHINKKILGHALKFGTTQGFSLRKSIWVTWKLAALHRRADESTKNAESFCRREI